MPPDFDRARALFLQGVQAFESGHLQEAEQHFEGSLQALPGRPSTLANLAAVRWRLGRPAEALVALDQALAQDDRDAAAWFHRGQVLQALERPADALASYRRVLALDAHHGPAWSQCGAILKDMGRLPEAAEHFRQALAQGADTELNRYFLASVEQALGTPSAAAPLPPVAPAAYVEALFDSYAEGFDEHLVQRLGYRTPDLLAALLAQHATSGGLNVGTPAGAALDLGCGTGLMAPLLAPRHPLIDGVDLSSAMLQRAAQRGLYRQLTHAEVVTHLQHTDERYALVAAADVLVYLGALEPLMAGVARVLLPGGSFLYSVEEADADGAPAGYTLRASSRFAHSERYLRQLAQDHGFNVLALQRATLRQDQRQPITGLCVLMQHVGAKT